MSLKDYAIELIKKNDTLKAVSEKREVLWINDRLLPFEMVDWESQGMISDEAILDAQMRLKRFAPFICKCFPETESLNGIIESPLKVISCMQREIEKNYDCQISGSLFLKMDSHLAVAGSIKARGGIYEVLKHAEDIAISEGKLKINDNYEKLATKEMKDFFHSYTIQVGSTGNLGLSIGICSAAIGFRVIVHMSADAKEWKKNLLRSKGVQVIEYKEDYSKAVAEGRKLSKEDPKSYFVDDEKSVDLFLGYAVAAFRLQEQLVNKNIVVDENHPLICYIPCGVGGAPGGVAYGLKRLYKDHVHIFFVEPILCPSVLLGFATGMNEKVNVHDFDINGITQADGLACASPSGFVTRIDANIVSGDFTVEDAKLFTFLRDLHYTENILIEPSSCAAFIGPASLERIEEGKRYLSEHGLTKDKMKNATQIVWATGGSLVPTEIWDEYLRY